jgi:membrane protein DedA with SNARE-associated domain
MMLVIISLMFGMVLGQRFNVLVLVPAIALVATVSVIVGVARADAIWSIAQTAVAATVSLQIGYAMGIWIRSLLADVSPNRSHATTVGGSSPTRRPAH